MQCARVKQRLIRIRFNFGDNFIRSYSSDHSFVNMNGMKESERIFPHLFPHSRIVFFNVYNLLDFQRIILQPETVATTSSLLFTFALFPFGDIWRLEISVKIIRHRPNSSTLTFSSRKRGERGGEADMHCALSSDKRGMKRPFLPRGEVFPLGLPFWFTCVDTPRIQCGIREGGPRVRKEP